MKKFFSMFIFCCVVPCSALIVLIFSFSDLLTLALAFFPHTLSHKLSAHTCSRLFQKMSHFLFSTPVPFVHNCVHVHFLTLVFTFLI